MENLYQILILLIFNVPNVNIILLKENEQGQLNTVNGFKLIQKATSQDSTLVVYILQ
ncbi:hypothetical protein [Escherichia coli IS1]|nr:hypothetical protein [Escherichia coli IS1]